MANYQVSPVESRSDQRAFMQLIWDLYRNDPNWIPPIRINQMELVGFKPHPFYDNAKCQAMLCRKDGRVVGRILALINYGHIQRYDEKRGFFGFFECIDDREAAHALFQAACQYLKREGMTDVRGPCNPSLNYELGTLVEGFDTPPTFMMTYNPPYHDSLIKSFGFEKTQDLYSYVGNISMLDSMDPKIMQMMNQVKERFNIRVRPASRKNFAADVELFLDIYNRALQGTWGFVPMSPAETRSVGESLRYLIDPDVTSVIEVDGEPVGVGLGLLDYNPIIKKIDGRLFPFGFLRLLWERRRIKRIRLISTNIVPEWQRWGLGLVLLHRMLPDCLARGITEAEFSWVLESNQLSRGSIERGKVPRTKTHRVYDRSLADI
ncbi:MAG: GNAT family N-acetyltransferase [Planctomycetota bacterium]|jgi:GNAT superfamily N-acetyltransferase